MSTHRYGADGTPRDKDSYCCRTRAIRVQLACTQAHGMFHSPTSLTYAISSVHGWIQCYSPWALTVRGSRVRMSNHGQDAPSPDECWPHQHLVEIHLVQYWSAPAMCRAQQLGSHAITPASASAPFAPPRGYTALAGLTMPRGCHEEFQRQRPGPFQLPGVGSLLQQDSRSS